ncbi:MULTISPECIES: DUF2760 domain-containing protein [unclassified Lentimonas]|uniref:DUF2760 domain-containing protein n=1 Tax=unclassified Lentimonas TaxID=2630993 RepID=UPI0013223F17|nr:MULTISPECIES: DUF2760 domain-containing protein [unclassified Lentimonas]CAA6696832.1 Unannotated [Lentimonas sp. CC10]CAA6697761.1 Unannotated [Lentimonas sp. CC19]CAA7071385.1 Unannotated [Lentimonas sp. CC11]
MTKPFIIILSLTVAVLGVLSTQPAFAEKTHLLAYAVIALALVICVLSFCVKSSCCVKSEPVAAESEPAPSVPETRAPEIAAIPEQSGEVQVAQLLSLLQEKGRFLDFVMDDIKSVPDAQIAAAARFVHQGCQSVMQSNFKIEPVATVAENQSITLAEDYERGDYRLSGKIEGQPPHTGTLKHKGWKTASISLPKVMGDRANAKGAHLLAAAEVEVR